MQIAPVKDTAPYIPLMRDCVGASAERELKEYAENPQYKLFGNEDGFIIIMPTPDNCDVIDIAVEKSARRKGVGTALLRYAEDYCKQTGIRGMMLEVRASNQTAMDFYLKNGFEPISERRNYYSDPVEDAIILRKIL